MGILVLSRWTARASAGVLLVSALLALVPAALLDVGPEGNVRFSFFPLVLTCFDPFIRHSLGHSVLIAAVVSLGSRLLGIPLGRLLFGSRLLGRRLGLALFAAPVVFPPAFLALGLLGYPELSRGIERIHPLLSRVLSGLGFIPWSREDALGWLGWTAVGMLQGVGLILLILRHGLDRFDRSWHDTARLAGLTDRQIWKGLIWPSVRPGVARGVKLLFALNLVECGIPMVLGLRRTIGFQLVEIAGEPDPFPRLAALALLTLGCLAVASLAIRLWIGRFRLVGDPSSGQVFQPLWISPRPWYRELLSLLILVPWLVLAWSPIAGLARLVLARGGSHSTGLVELIAADLTDPLTVQALGNTLVIGLAACLVFWIVGGPGSTAASGRGRFGPMPIWGIANVPPLLLGVACLGLARGLDLLGRTLPDAPGGSAVARGFDRVVSRLDPVGSPLVLLAMAVGLEVVRRTWPRRDLSDEGRELTRNRWDVARLMGLGVPRSARLPRGRGLFVGLARSAFVGGVLSVSLAPAVALGPTAEGRPITPEIVGLVRQGGDSVGQAATLALLLCGLLLTGWFVAVLSAGKSGNPLSAALRRWCDLDETRSRL